MQRLARLVLVLVAGIFAALPKPLEAQMRQQDELGDPRYAGWVFTPSFATGGTWDDNLLLVHRDDPLIQDYATPINPSLLLEYRGRRTLLATSYDSSFLLYRELSELNSTQQGLNVKLQHRLSPRFSMTVDESFVQAPTTDVITLGNVPFFHIGTRSNTAGAGLEAAITRNSVVKLNYNLNSVQFDVDRQLERQLQGGHAHEGLLSYSHAVSRRFKLGVQYELRQASVGNGADSFNIQGGAITGEYRLTPLAIVSAFVGASRLGAGAQHEAQTGPTVGISIVRRARLASLSAGYQRTFIPSWAFGGTSQNEEWFANVQIPFARNRAYVRTHVSFQDADSLVARYPSLRSVWLGGTLGYRATRWLSLEAFYTGTGQDSNQAGGNRRRNVLGFRIVTAKPMKLG